MSFLNISYNVERFDSVNCPRLFTLNIIYGNGMQECSSEVLYVHCDAIMYGHGQVTSQFVIQGPYV